MLTGARATPIHLFGHSGGAQFVHRYVMAYPHRVAGAAVVNSGWYTFPKRRRRFPHGIRRSRSLPDVRFDPDEFLRVPIAVLVGEQDTATESLRRSARVQRQQGADRIERGRNWVEAMHAAAVKRELEPLVSFELLPQGTHAFAELMSTCDLGARVMTALFEARSSVG
jgi:pimeloyl-ACP methyl ester carboxylesterase